jgi:ubiquitin-activating enzyme E1
MSRDSEENKQYEVKSTGPYTFELVGLDLTAVESNPNQQGYITQVKRPVTLHFKTYEVALGETPEMLSDFAKFDRPAVLHVAYQALAAYRDAHGDYPSPGDRAAAQAVLDMAKSINADVCEGQDRIIMQLASGAKAILVPMCAALGGMVRTRSSQGMLWKFTPIPGFFYFDADETLPDDLLPPHQVAPTNSRYDSQIACFGKTMQQKFLDLRYLL